jgi:hypothetical protein
LIERARIEPGYGGAWFENKPCYRLVLAFTDGRPRASIIAAAEPWLRPFLGFAKSAATEAERDAAGERIRMAMSGVVRRGAFFVGGPLDLFQVFVATDAERDALLARLSAADRALVRIRVGPVPMPQPE